MRNGLRVSKQQGFIQAVLLFGIALMTIVLAGFALANRNPSGNLNEQESKVIAGIVLQQATTLASAINAYMADYNQSRVVASMTFTDTANDNSLFRTDRSYGTVQVLDNPKAFVDDTTFLRNVNPGTYAAGSWRLNKNIRINGLGAAANPEISVVLPNLTQQVCEEINSSLYGRSRQTPISVTATPAAFAGAADGTGTLVTAVDLSAVAALLRLDKACVQVTGGGYMYYQVVLEQ